MSDNSNKNTLTYSIATEQLYGTVNAQEFSMRAWSGGGRGQKGNAAEHSADSYDVFRKTKGSKKKHVHGGPLPPGRYICNYIAKHKKFGECIFLESLPSAWVTVDTRGGIRFYDRDGFFIHGRGNHGSDGCIIPELDTERLRLNLAIKETKDIVLLKVVEPGMPLPPLLDTVDNGNRVA